MEKIVKKTIVVIAVPVLVGMAIVIGGVVATVGTITDLMSKR